MNIISKEKLQFLRQKFPPGTRVELTSMNDPYTKLPKGTAGTVISVDDMATLCITDI